MNITTLVKLTSRAWSLTILALLHRGVPGRQAPLLSASGAGRTAFSHSLAHLRAMGLVERNPGHGHPLRPEFRLTEEGRVMAAMADRILGAIPDRADPILLRRSWTLPILATARTQRPFGAIRSDLSPITDRALSQSLRQLQAADWLARTVDTADHPPRPYYRAVNAGAEIARAIGNF